MFSNEVTSFLFFSVRIIGLIQLHNNESLPIRVHHHFKDTFFTFSFLFLRFKLYCQEKFQVYLKLNINDQVIFKICLQFQTTISCLIFIISMNSNQKTQKKDFSLSQYYSQLNKVENSVPSFKGAPLKKDASQSSLTRQKLKPSVLQKNNKEPLFQDKSRLEIFNKYSYKSPQQKIDMSRLQNLKKAFGNSEKVNNYTDSMTTSNVTHKQWFKESQTSQKQNIDFSKKDKQIFVQHCSQLYNLNTNGDIVKEIAKQINKRDEVYQLVSQHFGPQERQSYEQKLQRHFEEHELMGKVIEQFKNISKLEITDLSQLYYFLKSDS